MDELKSKFLGFINKQGASSKIPSMGFSDEVYHQTNTEVLSVNSKTVSEINRPDDQAILESIEDIYFTQNLDFDIARYELEKLPDVLDCDKIECDFKNLKVQQQVVSKKVLNLILEQQSACTEEFNRILEVKNELETCLNTCSDGRCELNLAKNQFTSSLGILANYRKRQIIKGLLHSLNTIKTLHSSEEKLQELLYEENYPGAILLLKECISVASMYRHFTCVAALSRKLQDTLVMAEEQLGQALASICCNFDAELYSKLQSAYGKLGKTQMAIDQLHMHYTSAVHNTTFRIVHKYAQNNADQPANESIIAKKKYNELCMCVSQEDFIPCLIELCKNLWNIISSYYQTQNWHSKRESSDTLTVISDASTAIVTNEPLCIDVEETFNKQYIKQKLELGQAKMWSDVQIKVSSFLMNSDLAYYKFEQFVQVLSIVHRLMEVGEEFCGSKSEDLQESIRKQSVNYFKNYHLTCLEELRIFLENDSWEVCPVKAKFDILQLQEFKSIRNILKNFKNRHPTLPDPGRSSTDGSSSNHSQDGSSVIGNYFLRYDRNISPFDSGLDDTIIEEDILATYTDENSGYFSEDSDSESDELRKEFVDENPTEKTEQSSAKIKKGKPVYKGPILTNTTLTVLRQIGKYLQMCRLLQTIAFDIIMCMTQLFDYYLYAVHSFFTSDLTISSNSLYTIKLTSTLKRISENLITDLQTKDTALNNTNHQKILKPHLSELVDLTNPQVLHGLTQRIIAVESLVFLARQFDFIHSYLEHVVPQENKRIISQFYNNTISVASDLRKPVYMSAVAQAFDLRQTLISMSKINWEVKDVMSQHSSYVDILVKGIQVFSMRLEEYIATHIHIPKEVYSSLWENIAHIVTHTLVEGFSNAKKCSNGGRALMQLDFTQFMSKFEIIASMRPMPHREYVEVYVKAYYLPENQLENFIKEHGEYSSKHLVGLVSCACQNNKKTKQRLYSLIEEMEKIAR